ncbi:MAG: hypothetical protein VCF24_13120 [Candidatus Latescibacterota bacterium]
MRLDVPAERLNQRSISASDAGGDFNSPAFIKQVRITSESSLLIDELALVPVDHNKRLRATAVRAIMHWTHQDSWAVREGPWKLTVEGDKGFLVNLDDDPGELHNLGSQRQDLVQRFVDSHNNWMKAISDRRTSGV